MRGTPQTSRLIRMLARCVTILGLLIASVGATATSSASPAPALQPTGVVSGLDVARVPGAQEAVGRSFDSYDTSRSAGIGHLEFAVIAFADAEAATEAMPEVIPALNAIFHQDAEPAEPPALGDEALAWNAAGPQDLTIAILIVRDDATIHLLIAVAESGEPLETLASIADGIIDRDRSATPAATPAAPADQRPLTSGGLWDLLPRYDDLPGTFELYSEESWPVEEPAGVPPLANPADCTIEPRPRSDFEVMAAGSPTTDTPPPTATPVSFASPGAGEPADAATIDGVTASIQTYVTCLALGDWPRAFAMLTDRQFHEQVAQMPPGLIEQMFTGQPVPPVAEGPRLAEVRDVVVLPDGRIGAVAVVVTVFEQEVKEEPTWVWLVREGDRYRIDGLAPIE